MIHFNNEKEIPNTFFGGSEQKRAYEIDGKIYMVKFPDPVRQKKNDLSYMNNQFSEYIGCHIFRSSQKNGIDKIRQETATGISFLRCLLLFLAMKTLNAVLLVQFYGSLHELRGILGTS